MQEKGLTSEARNKQAHDKEALQNHSMHTSPTGVFTVLSISAPFEH